MKKLTAIKVVFLCFILTGCTVVNVTVDDKTCSVDYYTAFRDAVAIDYSVCGGRAIVKKTETKAGSLEAILLKKLTK